MFSFLFLGPGHFATHFTSLFEFKVIYFKTCRFYDNKCRFCA